MSLFLHWPQKSFSTSFNHFAPNSVAHLWTFHGTSMCRGTHWLKIVPLKCFQIQMLRRFYESRKILWFSKFISAIWALEKLVLKAGGLGSLCSILYSWMQDCRKWFWSHPGMQVLILRLFNSNPHEIPKRKKPLKFRSSPTPTKTKPGLFNFPFYFAM